MSEEIKTTQWSRVPMWVKAKIEELGVSNAEDWIQKKIPALGNRSVVELASSSEGQAVLRDYFSKVIGRF